MRKLGARSRRGTLILVETLRYASGIYVWKKVVDPHSTSGTMYLVLYLLPNGHFAYYGCWPEFEYWIIKGFWKKMD